MPAIVSNREKNPALEWWDALDTAIGEGNAPEELEELASNESVELTKAQLETVMDFAESLPGWNAGADGASYPFTVVG
jgi:hypothetical protein